ncbi:MAG: L-histidine N(alpha)-methyltransferase [Acidimicrobiia bacterium]|nr:L-histidine N(alpha)-methyltransferase [Acidimicrobiia bacterium]
MPTSALTVEVALDPYTFRAQLVADARAGLTAQPKTLPPVWFYDERGSQLFDEITRLQEYYPTRAERRLLERHAGEIAALSGADTLVELGSGTSEKTRVLLDALAAAGALARYVPLDVSIEVLTAAAEDIARAYGIDVHALVGDFTQHLDRLPGGGRRLVAFLGSTIGNLAPVARARFLRALGDQLGPGDGLLLGTDLVKDRARLVAAYDDAAGVTAEFNRNVLLVLNRELGADFDVEDFAHHALWSEEQRWIEMRLRALRPLSVRVEQLDLDITFAEGEELRTETSAKFTVDQVHDELAAARLAVTATFGVDEGEYLLTLAAPA